jgi:septum formation protein
VRREQGSARNVRIVLASASPRRREFLENLGLRFEVKAANLDESRLPYEAPAAYVERLALAKAAAGGAPDAVAIGADTTVVVGEEILGKPADADDAARMLRLLSGTWHDVITAVAVGTAVRTVTTRVKFASLSEAQISWLARSGDGDDKAGAYGLQGLAGAFIERIDGSVSSVVGLPLAETLQLLSEAGAELPWT